MSEDDIATLYCDLMEELKARLQTISEVVGGVRHPTSDQHLRHNVFILEGLYLQLRKCCEILAVGLLVAQSTDESARSRKLLKEYRADKILNGIENINPMSFPRPIESGNWVPGETQLVREYPPVFTADDLKKLYFVCDDQLHWGRLVRILEEKLKELRQDLIKEWVVRLFDGLRNHKIDLPQRGRSLIVQMEDPKSGRVCCRFATLSR